MQSIHVVSPHRGGGAFYHFNSIQIGQLISHASVTARKAEFAVNARDLDASQIMHALGSCLALHQQLLYHQ